MKMVQLKYGMLYSTSLLTDLKGHTDKVALAEFSPDGKKFLTASDDGILLNYGM